eukprot:6198454-Alexandrium_andersonii.AAC.1
MRAFHGQKETVAPHIARTLLEAQLRKAKGVVGVMGYYDRLEVNHPDRSYEWLIDQVKKRLDSTHAEGQRVKQEAAFSKELARVAQP